MSDDPRQTVLHTLLSRRGSVARITLRPEPILEIERDGRSFTHTLVAAGLRALRAGDVSDDLDALLRAAIEDDGEPGGPADRTAIVDLAWRALDELGAPTLQVPDATAWTEAAPAAPSGQSGSAVPAAPVRHESGPNGASPERCPPDGTPEEPVAAPPIPTAASDDAAAPGAVEVAGAVVGRAANDPPSDRGMGVTAGTDPTAARPALKLVLTLEPNDGEDTTYRALFGVNATDRDPFFLSLTVTDPDEAFARWPAVVTAAQAHWQVQLRYPAAPSSAGTRPRHAPAPPPTATTPVRATAKGAGRTSSTSSPQATPPSSRLLTPDPPAQMVPPHPQAAAGHPLPTAGGPGVPGEHTPIRPAGAGEGSLSPPTGTTTGPAGEPAARSEEANLSVQRPRKPASTGQLSFFSEAHEAAPAG